MFDWVPTMLLNIYDKDIYQKQGAALTVNYFLEKINQRCFL